jgi:arginase
MGTDVTVPPLMSIDTPALSQFIMAMTAATVILAPFHGGVRGDRVGTGPLRLMDMGLAQRIAAVADVNVLDLGEIPHCEGEVGRAFEVKRRVAKAVSEAVRVGRFPLVLAGNCNAEVGVFAGLGSPDVDVVWFDGHTDFYTPDDLSGGYFDSMGAAILTGQCWQRLAATVPGFRPLSPRRLLYCGSRNVEASLLERIAAEGARMIRGGEDRPREFAPALGGLLGANAASALIHLDVDCLDTSEGHANEYAVAGGLSGSDLLDCFDQILALSRPLALTVASFDPFQPGADRIGKIAMQAVERLIKELG